MKMQNQIESGTQGTPKLKIKSTPVPVGRYPRHSSSESLALGERVCECTYPQRDVAMTRIYQ